MAITNGYCSLNDLKAWLGISGSVDDTRLELAIEAASRAIDAETSRRFYAVSLTIYPIADLPDSVLLPEDLLTVTSIATDVTGTRVYETWGASDYELEPEAAPYRAVWVAPGSSRFFPVNERRRVQITGTWGYCAINAVPDAIERAALLLATRYFKRKDAPFGVIGTPELGFMRVTARDPEVRALLNPYRRYEVTGV